MLGELTRQLGLHKSTVSRALRGHPMVSPATRARVETAAQSMGYTPSPLLAHAAQRKIREAPGARNSAPFAFIYCPTEFAARIARPESLRFFAGAHARASTRGYKVELFNLVDYGSGRRLSQTLQARGITGVIVGQVLQPQPALELDWPAFSAVTCGYQLHAPPLHNVVHRGAVALAWSKALELGYRRIGLCAWLHSYGTVADRLSVAEFVTQSIAGHGTLEEVPLLFANDRNAILEWYRRHRPDVVIALTPQVAQWLTQDGVQIPDTTGFISLQSITGGASTTGCDHRPEDVAATAFDLCEAMVGRFERGLPEPPQTVCIPPLWNPGTTLPPRTPRRGRAPVLPLPAEVAIATVDALPS